MSNTKYDISIGKLTTILLPNCLRRSVLMSLMGAFTASLDTLASTFSSYRKEKYYRMSHNSQVCYLRAVLNDEFAISSATRTIKVEDTEDEYEGVFIHERESSNPLMLSLRSEKKEESIYGRDYGDTKFISFKVTAPSSMVRTIGQKTLLASLVNQYKLAGSRYSVIYT